VLRTLLAEQLWVGVAVVTLLYALDYQLSVAGVRWFRRGADQHYDLGGSYELNPPFEQDIEEEHLVSKTHILALVRIWVVLVLVWGLTEWLGAYQDAYMVFLGLFILTQMPVMLRHTQNIVLFRFVATRGGVEGRARTERWLEHKVSASVFWYFTAAYVLLWLLLGDVFFIGGVVGTALAGARFWIFGGEAEQAAADEAEDPDEALETSDATDAPSDPAE
jgi:hypothetical protein